MQIDEPNEEEINKYINHRRYLCSTYNSGSRVEFFSCPRGCISEGIHVDHQDSNILSLFSCPKCLQNWIVCRLCNKGRKVLDTVAKVKKHLACFHKDLQKFDKKKVNDLMSGDCGNLNIDMIWECGSCEIDHISNDIDDVVVNTSWDVFPPLKSMKCYIKEGQIISSNENNLRFFKKNKDGYGGSYLVGKSQFHIDDITNELQSAEVRLHLRVAKFCLSAKKMQVIGL